MASSEYKLAVVNGTSLSLSLNGPAGPTGPTGATGGVTSVAGRTGPVTLVSADITNASTGGNGTADNGKLVKFNEEGGVSFRSDTGVGIYASSLGGVAALQAYGTSGYGVWARSTDSPAVFGHSTNESGVRGYSISSNGVQAISVEGEFHARFGDTGDNRSFIARVKGAFGWLRNSERTLTIEAAATLDANRTYIIPDATGTTVPIVPAYTDLTAANTAALGAGTFFWNLALKKLQVTTA
jgi:hypothetical protein